MLLGLLRSAAPAELSRGLATAKAVPATQKTDLPWRRLFQAVCNGLETSFAHISLPKSCANEEAEASDGSLTNGPSKTRRRRVEVRPRYHLIAPREVGIVGLCMIVA